MMRWEWGREGGIASIEVQDTADEVEEDCSWLLVESRENDSGS
jgi:hypothetical protein